MPLLLQEGGTMAATGVEAAMDSASACADRHIKDCTSKPQHATGMTQYTVSCINICCLDA